MPTATIMAPAANGTASKQEAALWRSSRVAGDSGNVRDSWGRVPGQLRRGWETREAFPKVAPPFWTPSFTSSTWQPKQEVPLGVKREQKKTKITLSISIYSVYDTFVVVLLLLKAVTEFIPFKNDGGTKTTERRPCEFLWCSSLCLCAELFTEQKRFFAQRLNYFPGSCCSSLSAGHQVSEWKRWRLWENLWGPSFPPKLQAFKLLWWFPSNSWKWPAVLKSEP